MGVRTKSLGFISFPKLCQGVTIGNPLILLDKNGKETLCYVTLESCTVTFVSSPRNECVNALHKMYAEACGLVSTSLLWAERHTCSQHMLRCLHVHGFKLRLFPMGLPWVLILRPGMATFFGSKVSLMPR